MGRTLADGSGPATFLQVCSAPRRLKRPYPVVGTQVASPRPRLTLLLSLLPCLLLPASHQISSHCPSRSPARGGMRPPCLQVPLVFTSDSRRAPALDWGKENSSHLAEKAANWLPWETSGSIKACTYHLPGATLPQLSQWRSSSAACHPPRERARGRGEAGQKRLPVYIKEAAKHSPSTWPSLLSAATPALFQSPSFPGRLGWARNPTFTDPPPFSFSSRIIDPRSPAFIASFVHSCHRHLLCTYSELSPVLVPGNRGASMQGTDPQV